METVLEGNFKEANHLRNLDDVGSEKIRALDLNAKRGSIAGNEGFFIKGLDPTWTHGVLILHDSLQMFGTTRVPNLTNLSLAFSRQGSMIRWRGSIDHDGKITGSTVGPRNPEQEKVDKGRRRKTYQTREETKRDDPKRDSTIETIKSSLER